MNIFIFNPDMDCIGICDIYRSFVWKRKYNQMGEFLLFIPATIDNLSLLKLGNIIWKSDDEEAGIINYVKKMSSQNGDELWIVKGFFLTSLLELRILTSKFTSNNEFIEDAIYKMINLHIINPEEVKRRIPNFVLGDKKNYPDKTNFSRTFKTVYESVKDISKTQNYGFKTKFDTENKKYVFSLYKGKDKSIINTEGNDYVIFSYKLDNVLDLEFENSNITARNMAYVAGEDSGDNRKIIKLNDGLQGLKRRELYVDARDVQSETTTNVDSVLTERGNKRLKEHTECEFTNIKISSDSNYEYKKDYNLGDIVTIIHKSWGINVNLRIVEIHEVYENNKKEIFILLGDTLPSIIDLIDKEV